ncbi:MAG: hypothetical protein QOG07_4097 [Pseudonocardiales bacterium]|nr:hypothetical protein [Pseudonocardiales bacterium]
MLPGPRATPFTSVLLLALAATTMFLRAETDDSAVLRWTSTNLVNLDHHPLSALVTSAFVTEGSLGVDFVLLALVCAALERRSTTARTALVLTAGHVIASLVTEGAVRIAIALHTDPVSATRQVDVGYSYVLYTALGAVLRFVPGRWRWLGLVAAVGYLGVPFLGDPGMTTSGHLLCLAIGVLSWPYLVPARYPAERVDRRPVPVQRLGLADAGRARIGALAALAIVGVLTACTPGHYLFGPNHHQAQNVTAPQPSRTAALPGT